MSTLQSTRAPTKGDKARAIILEAAATAFAQHGYQATSIQGIANDVGVNQTSLLYHFPSKRDLFAAVINSIVDVNVAIAGKVVTSNDDARTRLEKHFEINYRWAAESDVVTPLMTGLIYFASFDAEFREIYVRVLKEARSKILGIVLAGIREKSLTLRHSPEITAELLHDGLLGIIITDVTGQLVKSSRLSARSKWLALVSATVGERQV